MKKRHEGSKSEKKNNRTFLVDLVNISSESAIRVSKIPLFFATSLFRFLAKFRSMFQELMNVFKNPSNGEWFNAVITHPPNVKALQLLGPTFAAHKILILVPENCRKYKIDKLIFGQKNCHVYISHFFRLE